MKARVALLVAVAVSVNACGGGGAPTAPPPPPAATPVLSAPALESPSADEQLDTLRPTLTVRNATSDQAGARTYEFQVSDSTSFTAATTSHVAGFAATIGATTVAEEADGTTSWTPAQDLQPTTRFYWRARAMQGTSTGEWSATGRFRSKLVGFNRASELYDPLIHGVTVGQRVGSTTFIAGRGIKLNSDGSHVRYLLPRTITSGEFSMDVEGLRADAPGDKTKVLGMQEGQSDFVTNPYRFDVQYRGSAADPPNVINWRVLYGSADDSSVRYEPSQAKRVASVYALTASTTYHWKIFWGSSVRVSLRAGGVDGAVLYDFGMPTPNGSYAPSPHYAYLGAPLGRSGTESASIPGAIYRNVWLSNRPRPASLGSALRDY